VARLRDTKVDSNPVLLLTNMAAGHFSATGASSRLQEQAAKYAWLLSVLGLA
jgi:oligopeptidase B